MAPQITHLQRLSIIALHNKGCRISEIERQTGISRTSVLFWLRRYKETGGDLSPRHRTTYKNATTPEQDAAIIAAHLNQPNKSTTETASEFNISADTVRRRLKQAALRSKKVTRNLKLPLRKALQLAKKNFRMKPKIENTNNEISETQTPEFSTENDADNVEQLLSCVDVKLEYESDTDVETDSIVNMEDLQEEKLSISRSLEVCIDSLESALNAIHGGAEEIEVCSSLPEGGLTPSVGLLKEILDVVEKISNKRVAHKSCPEGCSCLNLIKVPKVNVMLRCRAGSDFCYSQLEMDTMISDLEAFKTMKIDRFVFGALDSNQSIDIENCRRVLDSAAPIPVTFHRAFDVSRDAHDSLEFIIQLGFNRLLTSGLSASAADRDGKHMLKFLVNLAKDRIQIMPGAGINSSNVNLLKNIPCTIFHGSCKMKKSLKEGLAMGSSDNVSFYYVTDRDEVRRLKEVLANM